MLRVSAQATATDVDLQAINGDAESASVGIEFGLELMRFAEAVATGSADALRSARRDLNDAAGDAVLVDAAGVAANFQRMVRIADATGIPVDDMTTDLGRDVRRELGIARFASARNSLAS